MPPTYIATTSVQQVSGAISVRQVSGMGARFYVPTQFQPFPPGGPADIVPPVVELVSPAEGVSISSTTPLVVDVLEETTLAVALVFARFGGAGATELVHDGTKFVAPYNLASSSRDAIDGGYRYTVTRSGGWPAAPSLSVLAVDAAGQVVF